MLKFKSFKISDSDAINDFMKSNIFAKGSTVFHSVGEILIPYEDGELPNKEQKVLLMKEIRKEQIVQLDLISHSQRVLETDLKGVDGQIEKLESELITAPKGKEQVTSNQEKEREIKRLKNVKDQTEKIFTKNLEESTRLITNINVFDQRIQECK